MEVNTISKAQEKAAVEIKLLMLNQYVDESKLHVYKITGSDAVFITNVGNAPFAEEIKNHINGEVVDSKFNICKTNNAGDYFLTEVDNCEIPPEPLEIIHDVRPRSDRGNWRYTTKKE